MLVDVEFDQRFGEDFLLRRYLKSPFDKGAVVRHSTGVYITNGFSFELFFRGYQDRDLGNFSMVGTEWNDMNQFRHPEWMESYGACDSPDQLLKRLPKWITEGPDEFVIDMQLHKRNNPVDDECFWGRKSGAYYGELNEYEIDQVYVFNVHRVRKKSHRVRKKS